MDETSAGARANLVSDDNLEGRWRQRCRDRTYRLWRTPDDTWHFRASRPSGDSVALWHHRDRSLTDLARCVWPRMVAEIEALFSESWQAAVLIHRKRALVEARSGRRSAPLRQQEERAREHSVLVGLELADVVLSWLDALAARGAEGVCPIDGLSDCLATAVQQRREERSTKPAATRSTGSEPSSARASAV